MTTAQRMSIEEFLARPETKPAGEYVCGEVEQKPMPTGLHAIVQALVLAALRTYLNSRPIGEVGTEWRCVFGPRAGLRAYVPDVAYIAAGRLPPDPAQWDTHFSGAPDLVVEVLSRSDRPGRLARKLTFYLAHGVRLVWVVDPRERSVTVYAPGADDYRLRIGDVLTGDAVLPGFSAPVEDLFPRGRTA